MSHHQQDNSGDSRPLRQFVLLLFTAAVSFVLGIIIGRSSAPVQPIIKVTMPTEVQPAAAQNFNFYKALPKGETTALGSGINQRNTLPTPPTPPPATISQAEKPLPADPVNKSKEPPISSQKSSKEGAQGTWILQASSSPRERDAQNLSKRLRSKGYKTEVKPVLVKGKTWFRVYVGPYTSSAATKEAATKLSQQEGLAPVARKI